LTISVLRCRLFPGLALLALVSCAAGSDPARLATPGTFSAAPGNRAVTLTWAMEQDVSYTLFWDTSPGVSKTSQKITGVRSPHVHDNRENGVRVYYRLQAWNNKETSDLTEEVSALPDLKATAPGAPASVTAVACDGRVSLTWGNVTGASGYTLYRDTNSGVHPTNGTATQISSTMYDDTAVTNGVTYYYVVTATVGGAQGPPSAEVSATPGGGSSGAPSNLQATAGNGQVTLSWSAVSGASGYTLYWASATGVGTATGTAIPISSTGHVHTGLTNGQAYYYVVTASVGGLETAASSEASATPTGSTVTLPAPLSINAVAGDGKVTISWASVSGATSYTLYWQTTSGVTKSGATPVTGATAPHAHGGLTNGTTYYYAVTASNAAGESSLSVETSATPKKGGSTGHGTISGSLSGGAYGVVMLENTTANQGIVQIGVYTADPLGTPAGKPISGLSVSASGAVTGSLLAGTSAGTYQNTTAAALTAGTYVFSVSGSVSGTVTATVKNLPTCSITSPTQGSSHLAGKDLKLAWSSTNSDKASILLKDSMGTVSYPPLKPDPGAATVPGKDIPYKGTLQIMVSAVWSVQGTGAAIAVLDDAGLQVLLQ
jgi:fibronectin type 3 domain-containing protein